MMMNEIQELRQAGYKPAIVGPALFSLDKLLLYTDPVSDEETEKFVSDIYADRRRPANSKPE